MKYPTYIPWITLIVAVLAWVFVVMFAMNIATAEVDRVANIKTAEQSQAKSAIVARARSLARDTAEDRAQLATFLAVDLGSVADMIDAAGNISGVTVKLGDALPESAGNIKESPVKAVGFVVDAQGTFSALMHVAELFQTLPIPSSLSRLDLEHVPDATPGGGTVWHMTAHIRVLTTSDFSS